MIWESIRKNKVTYILILTIIVGYLSTYLDFGVGRFEHWNGSEGFTRPWHGWIVCHYIIGFLLCFMSFFECSRLDKNVLATYIFFDFLGFISYMYAGWPEPKELFIWAFCLSLIVFILLQIFRK